MKKDQADNDEDLTFMEHLAVFDKTGRVRNSHGDEEYDEIEALMRLTEPPKPSQGSPEFWSGLMRLDLTPQAAIAVAKDMMRDQQLAAVSPYSPLDKGIAVACDLPRAYRHILFKAGTDVHGREFPCSELDEHFQPDRASRLNWIPVVLKAPDRISCQGDKATAGKMHFYSCKVGDNEVFAVLVRELGKRFELTTAYSFSLADWMKKRSSLRQLYKKK